MAIPFTARINPVGATAEERQEELIRQLRQQNLQLEVIINDIYRQLSEVKKNEQCK